MFDTNRCLSILNNIFSCISSVIFPMDCCVCGKYCSNAICDSCWNDVILITDLACRKCSKPYFNQYLYEEGVELICEECCENALFFERALAYGVYQDVLIKIIHEFKFNNKPYIGKHLSYKLAKLIENEDDFRNADLIISVPLHRNKERKRGYNQSYLLAKELSKIMKIKLLKDVLYKVKDTESQSLKSMKERRKNIRGSFLIKNEGKIKEKSVILVDDVLTTGSTVNECSRILRHAGAKKVYVLTVARTA